MALSAFGLWSTGLLVTPEVVAQRAIPAVPVKPGEVRVDGALGEWRGTPFVRAGEADDGSFEVLFAHDPENLYVGARVLDDRLVRSERPGAKDDALVVTLALPNRSGNYVATEVWLHPGEMGKRAAVARVGKRKVSEVQIVEGPREDGRSGYVLEAMIPWRVLPGGRDQYLCRAAVRLHDIDGKGVAHKGPSTASGVSPARLPFVAFSNGANGAFSAFLSQQGLSGARPRFDRIADVADDPLLERVVVVGQYVAVLGQGDSFRYLALPVTAGADVREVAFADTRGRGQAQLLVTLRQRNDAGSRDLLQVWDLGQQPQAIFQAELRKETADGWVETEFHVGKASKGQAPTLTLRAGATKGLGPSNLRERPASGMVPILVPWGRTRERVYRYQDGAFQVVSEVDNPDVQAEAAQPDARTMPQRTPLRPGTGSAPEDLLARLRRDLGHSATVKPRFVQRVNVAGDGDKEVVLVLGNHLVIASPTAGGYFFASLPAASPADVQRVFTGDVTGDGRRDIFVRIKQWVGDVQREILFAYMLDGRSIWPLAQVEVRRAQGANSVGNVVRLSKLGSHPVLEIAPGRANGWDADSYPFQPGSQDGYGALLLPWRDRTTRYRYADQRLEPAP